MAENVLIFLLSALVLAYSSGFLVKSLTNLAIKLKFSEFLVGFVLMAVATSLPELMVGIVAALEGNPLISLGNVVGSNIANLSIVIGLPLLLAGGLTFTSSLRKEEVVYMNLAAVMPLILLLDGKLGRFEGIALLLVFGYYMYDLIFHSKAYHRVFRNHHAPRSLGQEILFFSLGMALLLGSAIALVESGEFLATALGIPAILIGIVIIALGTSLPELAFSFASVRQKHPDLLFGDVIGSVVTNATLILGLTAIISPIQLDGAELYYPAVGVLILTLAFFTYRLRNGKFTVKDSLILVFGYLLFAILSVLSGTLG